MRPLASIAAVLALVACVGCGPAKVNTVTVSGKVTLDSQPISKGSITFVAADGGTPTGGGSIVDGAYTADVPPGKKVVLVVGSKLIGQEKVYADMPDSPMRDKYQTITPPAYNAEHLTSLKADITESKTGLDFDLTAKPAAK